MSVTQFTAARGHLTALWQDLDHEQDTNGTKEHADTLADLLAADKALACHAALVEALRKSEQRIAELCDTVNTLAKFRKVRAEDYADEARAALKAAGVSS